jgi:hypothetical protein
MSLLWTGGGVGLAVLAIAQMGIHLVFFLRITSGPDSTNNILALAFGLLSNRCRNGDSDHGACQSRWAQARARSRGRPLQAVDVS